MEEGLRAVAIARQKYQLGLGQLKAYGQKSEGVRATPSVYKDSIFFMVMTDYDYDANLTLAWHFLILTLA